MTTPTTQTPEPRALVLREFTKHDWDGWAGAERGPAGELPRLGDAQVTIFPAGAAEPYLADATVIVDANGIEVSVYPPEELEDEDVLTVRLDTSLELGTYLATQLFRTAPGLPLLRKLGFVPLMGAEWPDYIS